MVARRPGNDEELAPAARAAHARRRGLLVGRQVGQAHFLRVRRLALEQARDLGFGLGLASLAHQPMAAVADPEAAQHHQDGRHDRGGIHPAPRADLGQVRQDEEAHDGADQRADRLEGEGAQHQLAAVLAGDALGDDQVRRRIVAAQRQADAEQEHDQPEIVRAPGQPGQEQGEHDHLDHEHAAAAIDVGQAAESDRADHDAGQRGGADDALFDRRQPEILHDQRQGDAGHEHDQPLEELAGRGEQPDPPLHAGHRNEICRGAVGPGRRLVDVALDGARRLGHVMGLIEERT